MKKLTDTQLDSLLTQVQEHLLSIARSRGTRAAMQELINAQMAMGTMAKDLLRCSNEVVTSEEVRLMWAQSLLRDVPEPHLIVDECNALTFTVQQESEGTIHAG